MVITVRRNDQDGIGLKVKVKKGKEAIKIAIILSLFLITRSPFIYSFE